ncbi:carbohydrate ABC transporter permease [Lactococcus insecticola]|uniref:Maltose/maltodextrin transport system permease protein n=1 Tax=Pseudolactococcus insecticola TaxID=2709158 RepID=A0A6A0B6N2_9LACT|nr:sugar ABC transporter permease [Lactococcus insecticola]GFH40151.1 maltose ABC transporter permease [Lactococcus insecticola]
MDNLIIEEQYTMKDVFTKGDLITKLSFLFSGLNNLRNKQIIKGLAFLIAEILFLLTFVIQVVPAVGGLISLGTHTQGIHTVTKDGIKMQVAIAGDNSMLMMIFGLASLIFVAVYAYIFWCGLKSNRKLFAMQELHLNAPSLKEDFKTLTDGRFHMTLMTIPLVGVLIFTVLPLIYMTLLAFTNYDHNHLPPKHLFDWVGLTNFASIFTGRMAGTFLPLLTWTLIWAVFATVTNFFFGIILALLINTKGLKFKKVWRTIFVITMAVPQFVSLLTMKNLLSDWGPINQLLQNWGIINSPLPFLSDGLWAKFSIIFVNMWVGIPVTMLVSTGIIMNLPTEQIEAAEIDGANKFQIFKSITFPQILLIMTPTLIQQFIGNINNFNVIYLLTGGGPVNSSYYQAGETDLLVTWLYNLTVTAADYNLASVIGIIIFALSAIFSLLAYTHTKSYKEGGAA